MRVLHTADWHLGRTLYARQRHQEFAGFLDWLVHTINAQQVEALLIAGDVFDTTTPSHRAQELYYRFLCRMVESPCCRHVVIIAGNHDSPSFLAAPKELLAGFDIHIVSAAGASPDQEVIVLQDEKGTARAIVCAVPFLRDREIREITAGESIADKERALLSGIRAHYLAVSRVAETRRAAWGAELPVIGMGHLFAAGGTTLDGDGVRDLYVGSLAHITADIFPSTMDYVALGHLHVPQAVGGTDRVRYSGSPIPMGFGEARQKKSVCLVDFDARQPTIKALPVPVFQRLIQVRGQLDKLYDSLRQLVAESESVWVEASYTGEAIVTDLETTLHELVEDTPVILLRVKNQRPPSISHQANTDTLRNLDDLSPGEVFAQRLSGEELPPQQHEELLGTWQELLHLHAQADPMADPMASPKAGAGAETAADPKARPDTGLRADPRAD